MKEADPDFIMADVLSLSFQLLGDNARRNPKLLYDVNNFAAKAQQKKISEW